MWRVGRFLRSRGERLWVIVVMRGGFAYRAYCKTPLVGSWLGRGTSLRSFLMRPLAECGVTELASFRDELEMEAAATRMGMRDAVGLATGAN